MIEVFAGFVLTVVILKMAVAGLLLICVAALVVSKLQKFFGPANGGAAEPSRLTSRRWGTA